GFVVEQVLGHAIDWRGSHYRTTRGEEIDLVLEKRRRRIAIECKASSAPTVPRGFYAALEDLGIREAYVVAPVRDSYPLGRGGIGEVVNPGALLAILDRAA